MNKFRGGADSSWSNKQFSKQETVISEGGRSRLVYQIIFQTQNPHEFDMT